MKTLKQISIFAVALVVMALAGFATAPSVRAATQNYAVSMSGVVVVPFHVSGQYTATTNGVIRFAMPFKARVIGVGASARASGGTTPTLTVDLLDDGVSVLSAPIAVTAGSFAEGAIANASVADESVMTVNLAITGTSPTWNDITVFVTVLRE